MSYMYFWYKDHLSSNLDFGKFANWMIIIFIIAFIVVRMYAISSLQLWITIWSLNLYVLLEGCVLIAIIVFCMALLRLQECMSCGYLCRKYLCSVGCEVLFTSQVELHSNFNTMFTYLTTQIVQATNASIDSMPSIVVFDATHTAMAIANVIDSASIAFNHTLDQIWVTFFIHSIFFVFLYSTFLVKLFGALCVFQGAKNLLHLANKE